MGNRPETSSGCFEAENMNGRSSACEPMSERLRRVLKQFAALPAEKRAIALAQAGIIKKGEIKKTAVQLARRSKEKLKQRSTIQWGSFFENSSSTDALCEFVEKRIKTFKELEENCWTAECKIQVREMKKLGLKIARQRTRRTLRRQGIDWW